MTGWTIIFLSTSFGVEDLEACPWFLQTVPCTGTSQRGCIEDTVKDWRRRKRRKQMRCRMCGWRECSFFGVEGRKIRKKRGGGFYKVLGYNLVYHKFSSSDTSKDQTTYVITLFRMCYFCLTLLKGWSIKILTFIKVMYIIPRIWFVWSEGLI